MKFRFLFFVAIVMLAVVSCKNNDEPEELILSVPDIRIWAGKDTVVGISNGKLPLTVISNNREIAAGAAEGSNIHITTKTPGTAELIITDDEGKISKVKVYARTFAGGWRGYPVGSALPSVSIKAADAAFIDSLTLVLLDEARLPLSQSYSIGFGQTEFSEKIGNSVLREGSFVYSDLKLRLFFNNTEEDHQVEPLGGDAVRLTQDVTGKYQMLYPGKGITEVRIVRYLWLFTK